MKDHKGCTRGFHWFSQAFYARGGLSYREDTLDEFMIGMYDVVGGGTTGEFAIRWMKVGGNWTPRLEAFNDSWNALALFGDLLKGLSDLDCERPSPQVIYELLISLGIADLTRRTRPDD